MMINKSLVKSAVTDRTFRRALRAAMGMLDWLVADEASVVIAQNLNEEDALCQLPYELTDPMAVLDQGALNSHLLPGPSRQTADACRLD